MILKLIGGGGEGIIYILTSLNITPVSNKILFHHLVVSL